MKLLSDLERDICVKSEKARVNVFLFCFLMRNCSLSISKKSREGEKQKKRAEKETNHMRARKKNRALFFKLYSRSRERRKRERERERRAMSGVTTRAQKRRIGQRDLWDVIVNNDDVCFKHILPRLNRTDIKFLYEVNTETRALIKRSSRKEELEEAFHVEEMSSISTLEIAWDNVQWGTIHRNGLVMDQPWFCWKVARTKKLELLKWIREEKKCEWNAWTIAKAADQGNMEMVKYCVANKCPMDEGACGFAAKNGHLGILKYLREEVKTPWDWHTARMASENGHLHILEYLFERKYDHYDEYECYLAASNGHLDCLKYLHEVAKAPWDSDAVYFAHEDNQPECLQYLLDNNCPLPEGWRYEDGTLYAS
jgi:hypothetical protein